MFLDNLIEDNEHVWAAAVTAWDATVFDSLAEEAVRRAKAPPPVKRDFLADWPEHLLFSAERVAADDAADLADAADTTPPKGGVGPIPGGTAFHFPPGARPSEAQAICDTFP